MNEKLLDIRWKVSECFVKDCWCSIIEPENKITDENGFENYICPSGAIHKDIAEYIVELHNKNLKIKQIVQKIISEQNVR